MEETGDIIHLTKEDPDNWWTPWDLYHDLCDEHKIFPELDVCGDYNNKKCDEVITKSMDALACDWVSCKGVVDIWCNAPGKYIQQMVNKAKQEWFRHNMNIMMLIPVNTITNDGFKDIWGLFLNSKSVEIHPLFGIRPRFLDGRKDPQRPLTPNWQSRNGYIVLIFRKRY